MFEFLREKEMARILVGNIASLVLVGMFLAFFGVLPWPTPKDMVELNDKYDHMIAMKNQDNKWYRELEKDVARINIKVEKTHVHIESMKEDIREIKQAVRKIK